MGKIIVVEDDSDLREEIATSLRLSGFETEGVGAAAAELYRRMAVVKFSILALDLRQPASYWKQYVYCPWLFRPQLRQWPHLRTVRGWI